MTSSTIKAQLHFLESIRSAGVDGAVLCTPEEEERIRDAWRVRFGGPLRKRFGRYAYGGYEWHAFSYETVPCLTLEAAVTEYSRRTGPVLVLSAYTKARPFCARCATPPRFVTPTVRRSLPPDLLVFPDDFSWTFAMTHEAGQFGPYFAVAPNSPSL